MTEGLSKEEEKRINSCMYYAIYALCTVFMTGLMSFFIGGILFILNSDVWHFPIRWYWFAAAGGVVGFLYSLMSKSIKKDIGYLKS